MWRDLHLLSTVLGLVLYIIFFCLFFSIIMFFFYRFISPLMPFVLFFLNKNSLNLQKQHLCVCVFYRREGDRGTIILFFAKILQTFKKTDGGWVTLVASVFFSLFFPAQHIFFLQGCPILFAVVVFR